MSLRTATTGGDSHYTVLAVQWTWVEHRNLLRHADARASADIIYAYMIGCRFAGYAR